MTDQKLLDKQLENETIIRWDESRDTAVLYTASSAVRKQWKSFGFEIHESQTKDGWFSQVPIDRITYKPLRGKS